jgi:hypothetical protein
MQSFVFTFPDTEILIGGWKILESRNSKKDLACAKKSGNIPSNHWQAAIMKANFSLVTLFSLSLQRKRLYNLIYDYVTIIP